MMRGPDRRRDAREVEEMRYLERSVGRTALLAMRPMLHLSHKELWQLYVLEG